MDVLLTAIMKDGKQCQWAKYGALQVLGSAYHRHKEMHESFWAWLKNQNSINIMRSELKPGFVRYI